MAVMRPQDEEETALSVSRRKSPDASDGESQFDAIPGIQWEQMPDLHFPSLFAAWPGMGNVALNAARYLTGRLRMEQFGRIEAKPFASVEGIQIKDQKLLPLRLPEFRFYFYKHPENRGDLVLFIGDTQPLPHQGFAFAHLVLRAAEFWRVQRVYTSAALASSISHMDTPRVWGVATHHDLWSDLEKSGISPLRDGSISGLNGLMLGVAKQVGFEGICLLGELPYYTIGTDNPKSSLAVLEKLCGFWNLRVDFSDLREEALRKEMEIEEYIRQREGGTVSEEMLQQGDSGPEIPQ